MSRKLKLTLLLSAPLVVFVGLLLLLGQGLGNDPRLLPSALIDRPMPEFALPSLMEPARTLTQVDLAGEVALVNVWGTWCPSCYDEHPVLMKLAEGGVPIYGLNYKDERPKAIKWLAELGNPYRLNVVDAEGVLGLDLGVYGAPETYLLDQRGVIRYRHVGVITEAIWEDVFVPRIAMIEESPP